MQTIELLYWLREVNRKSDELSEMLIEHSREPLAADPELFKQRTALWREIVEVVAGLDRKLTATSSQSPNPFAGGN